MKLSRALHVLAKFAANGHIDPDLFTIFIEQKVYMTYAQAFLHEDQIDAIDHEYLLERARGFGLTRQF